jgi:DHA2 family multidrug resistance protein
MLVIARVLQGLTGGGLLAKAQAILFETFPKEEQAMAQGLFGSIVIAGPAIGPTLGGYLVTNFDWRWIFFINVPLGILAVFMVINFMPKDTLRQVKSSIDWVAIGLLALGLGSLQAFLEEGNSEDWFDSKLVTLLAVGAVVGTFSFVQRVRKSPEPVVDLKVLRYRSLWAGSLLSVVVGMALYGALFAVPIYAQNFLHYSSQQTGMLLLPGALVSAFCMPIVAQLTQRFDTRKILVLGALTLISALYMLTKLSPLTGGDDFFWPLIVRAFGTVFMFMPLQLSALAPIPKKDIASATGFFSLTRQLGGSVGVALLTLLLDKRQVFHEGVISEHLTASDPRVFERVNGIAYALSQQGVELGLAKEKALMMLSGLVKQQAAIMSFADTFWATAMLVLCTLPLVLLLGKREAGTKIEMGH